MNKMLKNKLTSLPYLCSENAEIIGQHLTLRRWIQIISARIKGLKSVSQDSGKFESIVIFIFSHQ